MALSAGTRLGSYEIVAALGAGGMGGVYRARDTKLGRDVAIKILPELFLTDPDRVARFQREAQLLAARTHDTDVHRGEPDDGIRDTIFFKSAGRTYDVSPDGQKFLMIKDPATTNANTTRRSMIVVLNWFAELQQRVPAAK
jgi:serine/threonine protein kinase